MPQPLHRPDDPMAAHLTALYDRVARLERRPIGGFDPNENPVIIGAFASAGSGTPSVPTGGTAGATVVGPGAFVNAINATALGFDATVTGASAVAAGDSSEAFDNYGVAIGYNTIVHGSGAVGVGQAANTNSAGDVAVGRNTVTSGGGSAVAVGDGAAAFSNAVAVGSSASAGHTSAVALGNGATTTAAHQIVLGTSAETVHLWNLYGGHLPTTNPGAGSKLVWSNGGVLTVA